MFKHIRSLVGRLFNENQQMWVVMHLSDFFWYIRKYFLAVEINYPNEFLKNWSTIKSFSAQDKERNFTFYQLIKIHNEIFKGKKTNLIEKEEYVNHILSKIRYDFENESEPEINSLEELISESYLRFDKVRKRIGYATTTKIILKLTDERFAVISCNGEGYELTSSKEIKKINEFISIDTDVRLLYWLLQGPKKAHWNNAELGSHIQFRRVPNIYERGLWYCFNFFYSGKYT